MSNRVDKYLGEIDYKKDKYESEDFLDSLMFWVIVVVLAVAVIVLK